MTTVQFIYMMGVLWLICAGVMYKQADGEGFIGIEGVWLCFCLGLAHIGLVLTWLLWQLFRLLT